MPKTIADALRDRNLDLEDILPIELVRIIQNSSMVMHENADLKTITLVARSIHDKALGGASHMGGYGLAKHLKQHMGAEFFDRLLAAASSAIP